MKKITQFTIITLMTIILASCGNSKKESVSVLNEKKVKLEKLKKDKTSLDEEIKKLQAEVDKLDTGSSNSSKIKLVSVSSVTTQNFEHYIDLQGKIDAENISYISPRMGPGQVKAVYVQQGQYVKKGQLLLKLDDAIIRQQLVASRQQLEGIKTQLNFAKSIYQRQKNLWDQGIGTEVQLITAKTNVESFENQLRAANEQVKVSAVQLNTSNVYSDVNGVADEVNIRVGELFTGMNQIKIVNTSNLKAVANVPENYISRMKKGSPVIINIPDAGKSINTSISLISQSIDPTQRGFMAEAKIPNDPALKPNQSVIMKILDYSAKNAVVIPVNIIQSDETSKYVFILEKLSNGKTIAKRRPINIGEVNGNIVEVKTGLTGGEQIITEGYQNLYEGQLVGTDVK